MTDDYDLLANLAQRLRMDVPALCRRAAANDIQVEVWLEGVPISWGRFGMWPEGELGEPFTGLVAPWYPAPLLGNELTQMRDGKSPWRSEPLDELLRHGVARIRMVCDMATGAVGMVMPPHGKAVLVDRLAMARCSVDRLLAGQGWTNLVKATGAPATVADKEDPVRLALLDTIRQVRREAAAILEDAVTRGVLGLPPLLAESASDLDVYGLAESLKEVANYAADLALSAGVKPPRLTDRFRRKNAGANTVAELVADRTSIGRRTVRHGLRKRS